MVDKILYCYNCMQSTAGVCWQHRYTISVTVRTVVVDPETIEIQGKYYIRYFWQGAEIALIEEWQEVNN